MIAALNKNCMNEPSFVPIKSVVATQLDEGDGVLVDLDTKQYFQLNETAMLIWRAIENGRPMNRIVDEIVETYEVSNEQAFTSAKSLISKLQNHKLIRAADE